MRIESLNSNFLMNSLWDSITFWFKIRWDYKKQLMTNTVNIANIISNV